MCNEIDDDCDGDIDDGDAGVVGAPEWFLDRDGDGYGDPGSPTTACVRPLGAESESGDCNDADASVHPGATEACDGTDDDCDGLVDEACHAALAGLVDEGAADTTFLAPYAESNAGGFGVVLSDLNSDGLADFATWSATYGELNLHVAFGPLARAIDLAESSLVWQPGGRALSRPVGCATPVDVSGDGVSDWAIVLGADDGATGSIGAWLFAGPMTGAETMEDASLSVELNPPNGVAVRRDLAVTLVPGSPGTVLLNGTFYSGTDADNFTTAWAVSAGAVGKLDTNDLDRLETRFLGEWATDEAEVQSAGDLDGDGFGDVLRVDAYAIDVFLGPIVTGAGTIPIDVEFGVLPDDADRRFFSPAFTDLDGDGWEDFVLGGSCEVDGTAGEEHCVYRSETAAGQLTFAGDSPILAEGPIADYPVGPLVSLDANGDGVPDLAAGAPYHDEETGGDDGAVYLVYGPFDGSRTFGEDGSVIVGSAGTYLLGNRLAAGDSNGDGFDDLAVGSGNGAWSGDGNPVVWVFLGGP